ncbi:MAG: GGDEF domain-containing protein [Eubacteriales bacterium]|nr:GGDEF domain-containing protein [Eubacteriales bacterium]
MKQKKKIAIFATGWSNKILYPYLLGLRDEFAKESVDLYLFLCHAALNDNAENTIGELNIFELPDLKEFDAALIFANGLDFPQMLDEIKQRCDEANIPVILTGLDDGQHYFVGADNKIGMRDLCAHILDVHHVKNIVYIAGSRDSMDSNVRLQAIQDTMREHGLELEEKNIYYTNWEPYGVLQVFNKRIDLGDVPDAIVCVNDMLAMIVCEELGKRGMRIPEDILVTGFDNEFLAQVYSPSISSVDQRLDLIGEKCALILKKIWNGEPCERMHVVDCEFVSSESCGCVCAKDFDAVRRSIGRRKFLESMNDSSFTLRMTNIERGVMKGKEFNDLSKSFCQIYGGNNVYEKKSFHIILDPLFEKMVHNHDKKFRTKGYPEKMNAVFSMDEGNVKNISEFETKKLVPQIVDTEKNRLFIFLPLHDDERAMGYIVFCDDYEKVKETGALRKYVSRMNIVLSKHLNDLKVEVLHHRLLELTETDVLTHVKNRTAYESREEILEAGIASNDDYAFAIAIFDVNGLKQVNDQYGHEKGDDYIVRASQLICVTFKKSAVYRIGGDEFAVVLEGPDYEAREALMEQFVQKMNETEQEGKAIYEKVSVASGYATFDCKKDKSVADVFKRADARMYGNKYFMKNTGETSK